MNPVIAETGIGIIRSSRCFQLSGPLAGKTLRYVHTDSWEGGGMNWSPGFDKTFQQMSRLRSDTLAGCYGRVYRRESRSSNGFLADFRKTIGDRVADHYGQLTTLAQRHGMATHPECSGPHAGPLDGLKNYGRSEIMMSEFWSPSRHRPDSTERFLSSKLLRQLTPMANDWWVLRALRPSDRIGTMCHGLP